MIYVHRTIIVLLLLSTFIATLEASDRRPLGDLKVDPDLHNSRLRKYDTSILSGRGSLDYRDLGMVTSVKDQGYCGSCWAFTCIAAIESQILLSGGSIFNLSEQELISCDNDGSPADNYGCCGGSYYGWDFLLDHPLWNETDAPYGDYDWDVNGCAALPPYCSHPDCSDVLCADLSGADQEYRVTDYNTVTSDVDEIKAALISEGPLYFGFSVFEDFYTYWDSPSGTWTDDVYAYTSGSYLGRHAVLLIGYDDDAEIPYWILKNSWGIGGPLGDGIFRLASSETYFLNVQAASVEIGNPVPSTNPAGKAILFTLMTALLTTATIRRRQRD